MAFFRVSNPVKTEEVDTGTFSIYVSSRYQTYTRQVSIAEGTHLTAGVILADINPPANYNIEHFYIDSVVCSGGIATITFRLQTSSTGASTQCRFKLTHVYI